MSVDAKNRILESGSLAHSFTYSLIHFFTVFVSIHL
jgi:hypothetical protein